MGKDVFVMDEAFILEDVEFYTSSNSKQKCCFVQLEIRDLKIPEAIIAKAMNGNVVIDLEYCKVLARFGGDIVMFTNGSERQWLLIKSLSYGFKLINAMIGKKVNCSILFLNMPIETVEE